MSFFSYKSAPNVFLLSRKLGGHLGTLDVSGGGGGVGEIRALGPETRRFCDWEATSDSMS